MKSKTQAKKKIKKTILSGIAHIHATFNNTIVTITDEAGKVLLWTSAGALGFKGSKKSTPYVAQLVAAAAAKNSALYGMQRVKVQVKGPGPGREAAIRSLEVSGLKVTEIKDLTPVPHNGTRPPKRPRG